MNEQYIDTIHRFLNNDMGDAEREAFEAEIRSNPALQHDVELEQLLLAGLERAGEHKLRNTVGEVHQELKSTGFFDTAAHESRPPLRLVHSSKTSTMRRLLAIAATLVLVAASIWFFTKNGASVDQDAIFANHFNPGEESARAKTIITTLESIGFGPLTESDSLRMALQAYEDGHYDEALTLLKDITAAHPDNDAALYYTGIIHMSQERYAKAVEILLPISRSETSEFRNDALWNLGLCYLKMENAKDDAREAFTKLSEDNDYPKHRSAKAVLEQLFPK